MSSGTPSAPTSATAQRRNQLVALLVAFAVAALVVLAVVVRRQVQAVPIAAPAVRRSDVADGPKPRRRAEATDDVDSDEPFILDD